MDVLGIDKSRIDAMVAQLRTAATKMEEGLAVKKSGETTSESKVDFSQVLKASLDKVDQMQVNSQKLGQQFVMGDEKVSLSEVMMSMQKANISIQTALQVRSKLVSAYRDIMSMQI